MQHRNDSETNQSQPSKPKLTSRFGSEHGASLVEYGLLSGLILVVVVVAARHMGIRVQQRQMMSYIYLTCSQKDTPASLAKIRECETHMTHTDAARFHLWEGECFCGQPKVDAVCK